MSENGDDMSSYNRDDLMNEIYDDTLLGKEADKKKFKHSKQTLQEKQEFFII